MHAASIPDPFSAFSLANDVAADPSHRSTAPAIAEVQALRQIDLVAQPEWLDDHQPAAWARFGEISSGDQLRLPAPPSLDGPAIQASIGRLLAIDTRHQGDTKEVVEKEETMRRLLAALEHANQHIRRLAAAR